MSPAEPLADRRGYAITDLSHATVSYVFLKVDAAEAARAVAEATGGTASDGMPPNELPEALKQWRGRLLYQFRGHPWTIFMGSYDDHQTLAPTLSRAGFDVLSFCNEDVSGWSELVLFRGGKEVEKLTWGLDYSEEMEGLEEDEFPAPQAPATSEWDAEAKVELDEVATDQYLFRSKLREVGVEDLERGEAFVGETFRFHDAYLMDLNEQPGADGKNGVLRPGASGLEALAGAWAVVDGE